MYSGLQKSRTKLMPTIPKDFSSLVINGEHAITTSGEEFLRFDNQSSSNRIIIFVDDYSFKILSESEEWFMDGTFKSAPKQMMQLFTIHALVKNIFNVLKDLALGAKLILNSKRVMTDFEALSTFAIQFHFPNVVIKGCWFHFRQAIFRRAVRLGLKQHYHLDEHRELINLFGALALIPIEKINEGFEIIKLFKPNDAKCDQMLTYFENQWLNKIQPNIWNHFDSDIRTNNKIEGLHSGLNKQIISDHQNVFQLINFLKQKQSSNSIEYERLKQAQVVKNKSKKEETKQFQLELIKIEHKNSPKVKEFLQSLCQFIQYPYEYWFDEQNLEEYLIEEAEDDDNSQNDNPLQHQRFEFQRRNQYNGFQSIRGFKFVN
ncbi:Ragulator complex LAMTOR3 [Brachionus plicatilis]|uniref:Ragulator complex LAMTOR3 n=1 Tax=Brachionus plicatilis TaxID=10195 RepID=A0A3M7QP23_BRAPC|nr:Ragulator complex LAMTOR3 [Brachionus plicatilis]